MKVVFGLTRKETRQELERLVNNYEELPFVANNLRQGYLHGCSVEQVVIDGTPIPKYLPTTSKNGQSFHDWLVAQKKSDVNPLSLSSTTEIICLDHSSGITYESTVEEIMEWLGRGNPEITKRPEYVLPEPDGASVVFSRRFHANSFVLLFDQDRIRYFSISEHHSLPHLFGSFNIQHTTTSLGISLEEAFDGVTTVGDLRDNVRELASSKASWIKVWIDFLAKVALPFPANLADIIAASDETVETWYHDCKLAFLNVLLTGTKFDSQAVEAWFERLFLRGQFHNTLRWLYQYGESGSEAMVDELVMCDILSHAGTYTHDRTAGVGGRVVVDIGNHQRWFNIKRTVLDNNLFNYVAASRIWLTDNDTPVTVFE